MKKTLFLALMLMIAATSFAQQQIATLNHNDSISVFYGTYAFRDAHNAAVNGDIITLSSGSFAACDITKAITLLGAGCINDTIMDTYFTSLTGDFEFEIDCDSTERIVMEGVAMLDNVTFFKIHNSSFTRCFFNNLRNNVNGFVKNSQFINTIFNRLIFGNDNKNTSIHLINSIVFHLEYSDKDMIIMQNSFVCLHNYPVLVTATNSIITRKWGHYALAPNSNVSNSILVRHIGGTYSIYPESNPLYSLNKVFNGLNEVFNTFSDIDNFSLDERYILKEEIATSFLGSDGTEVGIHGGMFPFDTRPSYMIVKKCNVANKSTIDGKLSVDIEVMVEE